MEDALIDRCRKAANIAIRCNDYAGPHPNSAAFDREASRLLRAAAVWPR